ncbi:MAG: DNA polymerase III subunit gamma and tau, partial [Streptomyces sp.]|nr:DNA polymerase III subunit gamma and tau [Streptomyces sp.]
PPAAPYTPAPQPVAAATPAPAPQTAPPAAAGAYAPPAGSIDPRMLWPNILEAVKNRRRFTWILLSQNAQVTGFDGTTLQLGFVNAGARDNFVSSGSEEVLKQSLAEQFSVQWKIEALVDASGGSAPPQTGGATQNFSGGYGGGGTPGAPVASGTPGGPGGYGAPASQSPAPAARPQSAQSAPASPAPAQATPGPAPSAPAPRPSAPEPPPVAPEDDIPEDDDPDLNESALSGRELIVRELGATVMEEFTNE